MCGWFDQWLKINWRVILLTVVLLAVFDWSLERLILPYYFNAPAGKQQLAVENTERGPLIRRLPADDADTLTLWKQQLAGDQSFSVVFLGDSIVHGGGVPGEDQTIPSYLAYHLNSLRRDEPFQVYSFSLPGCTPTDTLKILRFIVDTRPDLVIYDVNVGWFGSPRVMEHPRLAQLGRSSRSGPSPGKPAEKKKPTQYIEGMIKDFATRHWALYRHRILLNYLWFGKPIKEKLALQVTQAEEVPPEERLTSPEEKFKPWYEKDFSALKQAKGKLGSCDLNDANQHLRSYREIISTLEENGIRAAFFMIPRNKTMYVRYNLLDEELLQAKQDQLANEARQRGIEVFDYTYAVDNRYFTDSVHMTAEGNQAVAKYLTWDLVKSGLIQMGE